MIKFKTRVVSSEKDEKSGYMSAVENEYTYYSTDGYTTCVSFNRKNLQKASAKSRGFFSRLFNTNEKSADKNVFKKSRFNRGQKIFNDNNGVLVVDNMGNAITTAT